MYYKIINDRQVFSNCKSIQMNDESWVSNPSEEQIAEAGWQVYVAPDPVVVPQTEPDYDQLLEAIKTMLNKDVENMTDEEALEVAALYPTWKSKLDKGEELTLNERLWYNIKLYKVIQAHIPQADWTPDVAVSLFREVSMATYPDWIQPIGPQDAYNKDERVSHNGKHWISDINGNVWEPGVYGWTEE